MTGPEMEYAAKAGSLSNPAGYKKAFADLTDTQRTELEGLYANDTDRQRCTSARLRGH